MVHREFLDQPDDEILERIWCRKEAGDDTVAGLLEHNDEPDAERILERLAARGLVALEQGRIRLREQGERRARALVRRNRLAERMLAEVLARISHQPSAAAPQSHDLTGFPSVGVLDVLASTPARSSVGKARDLARLRRLATNAGEKSGLELPLAESERTACLMEHVLNPAVTDAVCAFLGHPPTCPHGKPIPPGPCCTRRRGTMQPLVVPLTDLEPERAARIVFIAPATDRRLERLGAYGVVPGTVVTVAQKRPAFVIRIGGTTLAMEREAASEIFVRGEG